LLGLVLSSASGLRYGRIPNSLCIRFGCFASFCYARCLTMRTRLQAVMPRISFSSLVLSRQRKERKGVSNTEGGEGRIVFLLYPHRQGWESCNLCGPPRPSTTYPKKGVRGRHRGAATVSEHVSVNEGDTSCCMDTYTSSR
jgi:hypothetical protein